MRFLSLVVVALMVCATIAEETKLTEREMEEMKELQKRMETDPEFRREVEAQIDAKIADLPEEERVGAKKRFFGLLGLRFGLLNPFLFPFIGKRSVEETTVETPVEPTKREMEEMKELQTRLETDPEFRREVEAQLDAKVADLPEEERAEAKKRFWGLLGLGLWNPFLFPFFGKRSIEETTVETPVEVTTMEMTEDKAEMAKRFWGLWGLGYGYGLGLGYPFGLGLWGKKRTMEGEEEMAKVDEELMKKREEEFKRFEAAEKRLAPETFKAEGETFSKVEVEEMKKRWWGLGYGYGMGLGYGYGLGYPWGFWGKREATPMTGEKRDAFVLEEMKKVNREAAYERLLRDL